MTLEMIVAEKTPLGNETWRDYQRKESLWKTCDTDKIVEKPATADMDQ